MVWKALPAILVLALSAAVLGCGDSGNEGTTAAPQQTEPAETASPPAGGASDTGGATEAGGSAEGGACGSVSSYEIVVQSGDVDCAEATATFETYYDPATPKEGSGGSAQVGDWFCISASPGDLVRGQAVAAICESEAGGGEIVALAP